MVTMGLRIRHLVSRHWSALEISAIYYGIDDSITGIEVGSLDGGRLVLDIVFTHRVKLVVTVLLATLASLKVHGTARRWLG